MDDSERLRRAIALSQSQDLPCELCKSPTRGRAIFVPDDPVKSGVGRPPDGKKRMIIYGICEKHPQNIETSRAVELMLRFKYGGPETSRDH